MCTRVVYLFGLLTLSSFKIDFNYMIKKLCDSNNRNLSTGNSDG